MTKPYSNDLRERVVAAMQSGASCRSVAGQFGVAPSSVVKWARRAAQTGSVSSAQMGGYRRPILEPHRDWLLDQVQSRPHITLGMLQEMLAMRGIRSEPRHRLAVPARLWVQFQKKTMGADERERPDVKRRRDRWLRGWAPKGERLPGAAG